MGSLIDNFALPDVAVEAIKRQGLKEVQLDDGVNRLMSGHDKGVAYRFFISPVYNKTKSTVAGYEVFDDVEMIEWLIDRKNKPTELVRFLPPELLNFDRDGVCVGGRYKDSYLSFKTGRSTPGLPLAKWGQLSDGEVATLASMHIFTVEQLAEQPRGKFEGRMANEFVEAFDRAVQFVAGKEQRTVQAAQAAKMAELEAANKALLDRLAALENRAVVKKAKKEDSDLLADTLKEL